MVSLFILSKNKNKKKLENKKNRKMHQNMQFFKKLFIFWTGVKFISTVPHVFGKFWETGNHCCIRWSKLWLHTSNFHQETVVNCKMFIYNVLHTTYYNSVYEFWKQPIFLPSTLHIFGLKSWLKFESSLTGALSTDYCYQHNTYAHPGQSTEPLSANVKWPSAQSLFMSKWMLCTMNGSHSSSLLPQNSP